MSYDEILSTFFKDLFLTLITLHKRHLITDQEKSTLKGRTEKIILTPDWIIFSEEVRGMLQAYVTDGRQVIENGLL